MIHQKTDSDLILWGFVKCIFMVSPVLLSIPASDLCHKAAHSLKGAEAHSSPMEVSTQQYQVWDLFWFPEIMDFDNFVSFQTYLSLSKKSAKHMHCKISFFPLITPPEVFSAHLADIVCCIFKSTRECRSHRLDIFSYSLWILHAAIDPAGLHERQLQKRKVLIYLTCLKGVPKNYICCVYSCFSKKRNCFCIETFS